MKWTSRPTASEAALALALVGCGGGASPEPPPPLEPGPGEPPVPVRIAAGTYHACAVMSDGTARCWGNNGNAQLGHLCRAGHTPSTCHVASPIYADAELQVPLDRVVDLALGSSGSCAVRDDRTVWCWGNDGFGAFATGDRGPSATFPPVQSLITDVVHLSLGRSCCAILTDESLWCWSTWSDTDTSVVPVRSPWVDRAVGLPSQEPYCVLLPDDTVACRGRNHNGQVGDGTFEHREAFTPVVGLTAVSQVSRVAHSASCALGVAGDVACWGWGSALGNGGEDHSPLPVEVSLPGPAVSIDSGVSGTCAILDDATLWCWGANSRGQMGDGTKGGYRLLPVRVVDLDDVVQVAMGFDFSCALRGDHTVWCWGDNYFGQLGTGYADGPHPDGWASGSAVPRRVVFEDELDREVGDAP